MTLSTRFFTIGVKAFGDNNSDGKFDDVAAHDEFLETLNHGESISFFWVDGPRALLQRGRDGHAPWG